MSQQEEYQKLACKFVDVWQEHMATMLNDGEFIRILMSMMQGGGFSAKDAAYGQSFQQSTGSAAAAPDARDAAMARILASLAVIEERLERLEHITSRRSAKRTKTKGSLGRTAARSAARAGGGNRSTKKSNAVS